jgi:hypothetical protein
MGRPFAVAGPRRDPFPRPRFRALAGWLCAGLLLLAGCGAEASPAPAADALELSHRMAAAVRCRISVPSEALLERVRARLARRPSKRWIFELAVESAPPTQVAPLDSKEHSSGAREPRVWVGVPGLRGAERSLAALGVASLGGGFSFRGTAFEGREDAILATLPDLDRPTAAGALVSLVYGNDAEFAVERVRDWTPTSRLGWQLFRAGELVAEGPLDLHGRPIEARTLDLTLLDHSGSRAAQRGQRVDYDWAAAAAFDPEAAEGWLAALDRSAAGVRGRLAPLLAVDADLRVDVRLFETPEELSRATRTRDFAHHGRVGGRAQLSLVHVTGWPDNGAFEVARALALAGAGEPAAPWLEEAVAARSADHWFGRPLEEWLAHLVDGDLVPEVQVLASGAPTAGPGFSIHLRAPLRGALLGCCEELHGADFLARAWRAELGALELPSDAAFRAYLVRRLGPALAAAGEARAARRAASVGRESRRGACLLPSPPPAQLPDAPGGDPLAGGFGSRAAERTLAELRELGSTAVALSWCGSLEESEPRMFGEGPAAWTQAHDAALFSTILAAQSQGLAVTLLPQFTATEHGGWAGQVLLTTARRRRALFDAFGRNLTHLGLLAELAGVDVLSLGSESPDMTVTRPLPHNRRAPEELEALRSDWQILIQSARAAFAGGLTYAARWDGEAQGIEFWKDLDFLGQNIFAPLGPGPSARPASPAGGPSSEEIAERLVAGLGHVRDLARESGVRPLVCSVGLSSTSEGWIHPARPLGELDLEVQTRFYDGLKRALQLARQQKFTPAGLFAWCWWSDGASIGPTDRGFSPQNKPALAAFRRALQVR